MAAVALVGTIRLAAISALPRDRRGGHGEEKHLLSFARSSPDMVRADLVGGISGAARNEGSHADSG